MSRPDITAPMVGYVFHTTIGHPGQGALDLVYRAADPLVVGLRRSDSNGDVVWEFARDLLADGLRGYTGLGDIRIWPGAASHRAHIGVAMSSPHGRMAMWLPRVQVEKFLTRTFRLVPRGREDMGVAVDNTIAMLRPEVSS